MSRYSKSREAGDVHDEPAVCKARPRRARGAVPRRRGASHTTSEEAAMATAETSYRVLSLPQEAGEADGDRVFIRLRRSLDIGAFGAGASYQAKAGEPVVPEHDELGPGGDRQEELYVVVQGSATFTLDGEELDAPHGTVVLV